MPNHSRNKRTPKKQDTTTTNKKNTSNKLLSKSLAQDDAGVDDALSDTYTIADTDTLISDIDDLSIFDDVASDEEGGGGSGTTKNGTATKSSTTNKHYKFLLDVIELSSNVPTEKRSSKREVALRKLYKGLAEHSTLNNDCGELIESNLDDIIIPACLYGVTKGTTAAEQYASCRCIEVLCLILGYDRDSYYNVIYEPLRRTVMATGKSNSVRSASLRALSLSCFICSTDTEDETSELLNFCEEICTNDTWRGEYVSPLLKSTSLGCWALLATTLDDSILAGGDYGRGLNILPLLQKCLDHDYGELRTSAGECVTLIHEARLVLGIDKDEAANASDRRFRRGSWDGSEYEILMDELKQRIVELSNESSHYMSKKAKRLQRSTFREFMSTVVDDEPPNEIISFRHGNSIELTSWSQIIQCNFIRHCLQSGFQIHFMTNITLISLFGGNLQQEDDNDNGTSSNYNHNHNKLSSLEKRLTMSKTSDAAKSADRTMTRKRHNRQAAKNYFLTADGEDI